MNGLALLACATAALRVGGPVAWAAGRRLAVWGSLAVCALGALTALGYLLAGAPPETLAVPFGMAGQNSILALDGVCGWFLLLLMLAGAAASAAMLDEQAWPTAPAMPVFVGAMALTLLAGDAFALVAGFELMSLASFILVLTDHRSEATQAAARLYFGMAAISALCLIAALALMSGHGLSFAAMRAHPPEGWRAWAVLALVLIGPGAKAGLVPLHVWLPPAHAAAPAPVSALMSGAMTKVALYVIIRLLFDLAGPAQPLWWAGPLLVMGIASAVLGAFRANMETDIKAVLACSTVENVGLITLGLGLAMAARAADIAALAGLAFAAALLHVLGHGLFKTLMFLGAGSILHHAGSRSLSRLGGLMGRMPITAACMLLGAACLAGLPPSAGFASEWLLFQSVLAAVRLGGLGLQILVCVLAALLALATALAACAAVRLIGVGLLGRPRSTQAAEAVEAGPPMRWALLITSLLVALIGLFPGALLVLAEPALRLLSNASMAQRVGALVITPVAEQSGYVPLAVLGLLGLAGLIITAVLRARAVGGYRTGPAWDCGFGASFVDPRGQYSGAGFAQPLRRVLGGVLLNTSESLDMPEPGDTRAAIYNVRAEDPAIAFLFRPVADLRAWLSNKADRMQFLTVRQILTVMATALVGFLAFIALVEQL
jgi:formate hydrogenlyase subunit 3/multisubunit Na+/H+ antiporter MnhD subunit